MDVIQIFVLYLGIGSFHITHVQPVFQGFSIKKEFDVSLKPFVWKPISIIKETFSPFGRFGLRHGIQKRELLIEPAPVIEQDLHGEPPTTVGPFLTPVPKPKMIIFSPLKVDTSKPPLMSPSTMLPLIMPPASSPITSVKPPPPPPPPVVSTPPPIIVTPVPVFSFGPLSTLHPVVITPPTTKKPPLPVVQPAPPIITSTPIDFIFNSPVSLLIPSSNPGVSPVIPVVPPKPVSTPVPRPLQITGSLPGPVISTVGPASTSIIPVVSINEVNPQGLLHTDITRADLIKYYLNSISHQPIIVKPEVKDPAPPPVPPKPEVKDPLPSPPKPNIGIMPETLSNSMFGSGAFVRGTKVALYFSNILANLLSQFFSNARLTLSQLPELKIGE